MELIQKAWRRDMREEILEQNEEFPLFINSSLHVIYVLVLYIASMIVINVTL